MSELRARPCAVGEGMPMLTACARCGISSESHPKDPSACEKWVGSHCRECQTFMFSSTGGMCRICYVVNGLKTALSRTCKLCGQ